MTGIPDSRLDDILDHIKQADPELLQRNGLGLLDNSTGGGCTGNYEQEIHGVTDSLEFINALYEDTEYEFCVIKLLDSVEHIPDDIDLFVSSEHKGDLIRRLEANGMAVSQSSETEVKLEGEYLDIDIYTRVQYFGATFMEANQILRNTQTGAFFGQPFPQASRTTDLLILLPHAVFGHRRVSLLDICHVSCLMSEETYECCQRQARLLGWNSVFEALWNRFNELIYYAATGRDIETYPHVFRAAFVIENVGQLRENLNYSQYAIIYSYMAIERVFYLIEDTFVYKNLSRYRAVNWLTRRIGALFKSWRGDSSNS